LGANHSSLLLLVGGVRRLKCSGLSTMGARKGRRGGLGANHSSLLLLVGGVRRLKCSGISTMGARKGRRGGLGANHSSLLLLVGGIRFFAGRDEARSVCVQRSGLKRRSSICQRGVGVIDSAWVLGMV
jgi:hypothetical protein